VLFLTPVSATAMRLTVELQQARVLATRVVAQMPNVLHPVGRADVQFTTSSKAEGPDRYPGTWKQLSKFGGQSQEGCQGLIAKRQLFLATTPHLQCTKAEDHCCEGGTRQA
jgi:hypothetical protein